MTTSIIPKTKSKKPNVGSPFVIISKTPIEDPFNIDENINDDIILNTFDGTLLSFRESWAVEGNQQTGVSIKLFDPDHLILMRFIDENIVNGFRIFSKDPEKVNPFLEAREAIDELLKQNEQDKLKIQAIKNESSTTGAYRGYAAGMSTAVDTEPRLNKKIKEREQKIENITNQTGGFGVSNNFYITYGFGDSISNISPSRLFSFARFEISQTSKEQGVLNIGFVHHKSTTQRDIDRGTPDSNVNVLSKSFINTYGDALIAEFGLRTIIKHNFPSFVTLMEYTLQQFLYKTSNTDDIPLIFLSPEIHSAVKKLVEDSKEKNAKINKRTAPFIQKYKVFRILLQFFNNVGFQPTYSYGTHGGSWYYLGITRKKHLTPLEQVKEIINNIYSLLGIAKGRHIMSREIIQSDHLKYFKENFFTNGKDIYKTENAEYTNIDSEKKPDNSDAKILVVGDGLFIEGVLFPLPYDLNIKIIEEDMANATVNSNIHKFKEKINYNEYLDMIDKAYIKRVKEDNGFDIPDEFGLSISTEEFNNIKRNVPTFLSNVQHSNVVSFVGSHKRQEQTSLFSDLANVFNDDFPRAIIDYNKNRVHGSLGDSLTESDIELLIEDMIDHEYKKDGSLKRLLQSLKLSYTNNSTKAFEKIVNSLVTSIKNSSILENKKISINGLRTYLLYMQKLGLSYSKLQIKSVPRFNLDPIYWGSKPCIFIHKRLHSPNKTFGLNVNSPLSGVYMFVGFEHVITGGECFSSFTVHKVPIASAEAEESVDKVVE